MRNVVIFFFFLPFRGTTYIPLIEFHYFASEEVTIVLATHCTSKTVFKLDKSHFRVIVTTQIHDSFMSLYVIWKAFCSHQVI